MSPAMPSADSPQARLIELVQLLSGAPFEIAADAVACARIRHPADVDPFTLVAESLLMMRRRLTPAGAVPQSAGAVDPLVISLVGD